MAALTMRTTLACKNLLSDKVWGAAIISSSGGKISQYVSAWGKRNGKLSYGIGLAEPHNAAYTRYKASIAEKTAHGYVPYDDGSLIGLFQNLVTELSGQEVVKAELAKKTPSSSSTAVYPETCGYCYFKDRPPDHSFWNAVCTICGTSPRYGHTEVHPHSRSSPAGNKCAQFSQTPDQWKALGFVPGTLKMQGWPTPLEMHAHLLFEPKPIEPYGFSIKTPKIVDEEHCPGCIVQAFPNKNNQKLKEAFYTIECSSCGLLVHQHNYKHPHEMPGEECKVAWFPPEAYELVGLKEPEPSKVAEPEDDCPLCDVNMRTNITQSARKGFHAIKCLYCNRDLGRHGVFHPHVLGGCAGADIPDSAYAKAMMKAPTRAVPPPSATTRRAATESKPVELPNLPCDCEHLWSYHASHSEVLASGIELATFACLLITCRCEAYRHTCPECGEQTRRTVRHKATCLTYERSQLLAEPSVDTPTRKTRHQRLPRRISHLLLNDDD